MLVGFAAHSGYSASAQGFTSLSGYCNVDPDGADGVLHSTQPWLRMDDTSAAVVPSSRTGVAARLGGDDDFIPCTADALSECRRRGDVPCLLFYQSQQAGGGSDASDGDGNDVGGGDDGHGAAHFAGDAADDDDDEPWRPEDSEEYVAPARVNSVANGIAAYNGGLGARFDGDGYGALDVQHDNADGSPQFDDYRGNGDADGEYGDDDDDHHDASGDSGDDGGGVDSESATNRGGGVGGGPVAAAAAPHTGQKPVAWSRIHQGTGGAPATVKSPGPVAGVSTGVPKVGPAASGKPSTGGAAGSHGTAKAATAPAKAASSAAEKRWSASGSPKCLECGKVGHMQKNCPSVSCRRCGKVGHMSAACPLEEPTTSGGGGRGYVLV